MKLWQKNYKLNKEIEKFTVGDDFLVDKKLLKYDIIGSIAHAKMLNKIGFLNKKELEKMKKELNNILNKRDFVIKQSDEDVHTAVENYLIKKLGNIGKKIHTGRSRNDQIAVDIRLYSKEKLLEVEKELLALYTTLTKLTEKNKDVVMPGYTHMQKAMPSSVGLWLDSFADSLLDDLILVKTAYKLNNQCPLGSAAGYGVPLNIDRKFTADLLGFEKVQNNALYVQNSRGKIEADILYALAQIMLTLNKLATDLLLFTTKEFGFFSLADEFLTGSSIMPQKKNPDVLELIRAKSSVMQSYLFQVLNIIEDLPSGYNRDFQLIKKPLIQGFELALETVKTTNLVVSSLKVNKGNLKKACTEELFATEKALKLAKKGMPFRNAYKAVSKKKTKT